MAVAPLIDTKALIAAAMANASASASSLAATRPFRRLYVGNLPPTSEAELMAFLNAVIARAYRPGDHIASIFLNQDKHFGFAELRSVELASACMSLDGIQFKGQPMRVRRPNDYNAAAAPAPVR